MLKRISSRKKKRQSWLINNDEDGDEEDAGEPTKEELDMKANEHNQATLGSFGAGNRLLGNDSPYDSPCCPSSPPKNNTNEIQSNVDSRSNSWPSSKRNSGLEETFQAPKEMTVGRMCELSSMWAEDPVQPIDPSTSHPDHQDKPRRISKSKSGLYQSVIQAALPGARQKSRTFSGRNRPSLASVFAGCPPTVPSGDLLASPITPPPHSATLLGSLQSQLLEQRVMGGRLSMGSILANSHAHVARRTSVQFVTPDEMNSVEREREREREFPRNKSPSPSPPTVATAVLVAPVPSPPSPPQLSTTISAGPEMPLPKLDVPEEQPVVVAIANPMPVVAAPPARLPPPPPPLPPSTLSPPVADSDATSLSDSETVISKHPNNSLQISTADVTPDTSQQTSPVNSVPPAQTKSIIAKQVLRWDPLSQGDIANTVFDADFPQHHYAHHFDYVRRRNIAQRRSSGKRGSFSGSNDMASSPRSPTTPTMMENIYEEKSLLENGPRGLIIKRLSKNLEQDYFNSLGSPVDEMMFLLPEGPPQGEPGPKEGQLTGGAVHVDMIDDSGFGPVAHPSPIEMDVPKFEGNKFDLV